MLLTAGLMLGVYTILQVGQHGWGSAQTLGLGAVSVALLAAFVGRQARVANPLMPLRLFRSRNVTGANVVMALEVVGMFGMFFLGALYLQRVLGYSALDVGLAFLPTTLVMGTMSLRVAGPLMLRFGARSVLIASLVCIIAGLVLFAQTPVGGSYVTDILPALIFVGLGAGLGFPSLMTLAMSGATPSDSGLASGLVNTSVQVGGAIAIIAIDPISGRALGVARYVRLSEDPETAEAAVAVVDDRHGRGVAHALLAQLSIGAQHEGVHRFVALVQAENRDALALVEGIGDSNLQPAGPDLELVIKLKPVADRDSKPPQR